MTIEQFRKLCDQHHLTGAWAAQHVGQISLRSWQYLLAGRPGRPDPVPPADSVRRLQQLIKLLESWQDQTT